MVLEFVCPICMEEYTSTDEIYSTRCGHVFHGRCLDDWFRQNSTCPDCRAQCREKTRIFLKFQDSDQPREDLVKIRTELEQQVRSVSETQHLLDQSEQNVLDLHEQLDELQTQRTNLDEQCSYMKVISESMTREVESRKDEIFSLRKDLEEAKLKELALKEQLECAKKMISLDEKNINKENIVAQLNNSNGMAELNRELALKDGVINKLKDELRNKSIELEKEIRNSTVLIVDKMKLQSLINATGLSQQNNGINTNNQQQQQHGRHPQSVQQQQRQIQGRPQQYQQPSSTQGVMQQLSFTQRMMQQQSNKIIGGQDNDLISLNEQLNKSKLNDSVTNELQSSTNGKLVDNEVQQPRPNNKLVIRGLNSLPANVNDLVISIAITMNVTITKADIKNSFVLTKPDTALVVEFSRFNTRNAFLKNSHKLLANPIFSHVRVTEWIVNNNKTDNPKFNVLYAYAKKLQSIGIKFIFVKHNGVFARKNKMSPVFKVLSQSHVDELIKESKNNGGSSATSVRASSESICDDMFYAL